MMVAPAHVRGQALVEGVIILLALVVLWISSTWLFRLQDMALQTTHASRFAAFAAARGIEAGHVEQLVRRQFFSGHAHQWRTLAGQAWLSDARNEVSAIRQHHRDGSVTDSGPDDPLVSGLLLPWSLEGRHQVTSRIMLDPRHVTARYSPRLVRHQSILIGAAHGRNDADVVHRLGQSEEGWLSTANPSIATGQTLDQILQPLDAAWNRPEPTFDWLGNWAGAVPERHLQSWVGEGQ